MNRAQFMEQLAKLLSDISEAERNEALDYYESYFDDAGAENEASVIRELGSPGKVAAIIKADLKESNEKYAEYTEYGYEDTRTKEPSQVPGEYEGDRKSGRNPNGERRERGYHAEKKRNNAAVILAIILLIFISPLIKGAVGGVIGVLVTIALFPFLIVFILGMISLVLVVGAVACIVAGIGLCAGSVALGILTIGAGCLMMAVGIVCAVLLVWMVGRLLPKLIRKFTDFCSNLLHKERKGGAQA